MTVTWKTFLITASLALIFSASVKAADSDASSIPQKSIAIKKEDVLQGEGDRGPSSEEDRRVVAPPGADSFEEKSVVLEFLQTHVDKEANEENIKNISELSFSLDSESLNDEEAKQLGLILGSGILPVKNLDLEYSGISEKGMVSIWEGVERGKSPSTLTSLSLSMFEKQEGTIAALCKTMRSGNLSFLQILDLRETHMGNKGAMDLAHVFTLKKLQALICLSLGEIDDGGDKIEFAGAQAIGKALELSKPSFLEEFTFYGGNILGKGLMLLHETVNVIPSLKYFDLGKTRVTNNMVWDIFRTKMERLGWKRSDNLEIWKKKEDKEQVSSPCEGNADSLE